MSKFIIVVIVLVLIFGISLVYNERQKQQGCEERAVTAALEMYPIEEYPDTTERASLQEAYKANYLKSCQ